MMRTQMKITDISQANLILTLSPWITAEQAKNNLLMKMRRVITRTAMATAVTMVKNSDILLLAFKFIFKVRGVDEESESGNEGNRNVGDACDDVHIFCAFSFITATIVPNRS